MPSQYQYIGIDVTGVDELEFVLAALGPAISREVLVAALKKGAQKVAEEARTLAPRSGDPDSKTPISESIEVRSTLSKSQMRRRRNRGMDGSWAQVFVGSSAPHAHLVEFGHKLVRYIGEKRVQGRKGRWRTVKTGKVVYGSVAAYPFMRPAWDARKQEAWDTFKAEVWNVIVRVARKYRRQAERGRLSRRSIRALSTVGVVTRG